MPIQIRRITATAPTISAGLEKSILIELIEILSYASTWDEILAASVALPGAEAGG
jgi:hypothetical protein